MKIKYYRSISIVLFIIICILSYFIVSESVFTIEVSIPLIIIALIILVYLEKTIILNKKGEN